MKLARRSLCLVLTVAMLLCWLIVPARGESPEGQQAVAEVVLNRLVREGFPDTVEAVIRQGGFGSLGVIHQAEPSQAQYDAIDRGLYGPYVLPETVVRFYNYMADGPLWGQIGGHYFYTASEETP